MVSSDVKVTSSGDQFTHQANGLKTIAGHMTSHLDRAGKNGIALRFLGDAMLDRAEAGKGLDDCEAEGVAHLIFVLCKDLGQVAEYHRGAVDSLVEYADNQGVAA